MKISPDKISRLKPNEIFVFGSNESGIHGAGAARTAKLLFGAVAGCGVGRAGNTYALPTKDKYIVTLPLSKIAEYVSEFIVEARKHPELEFLVTQIGCGLAGYNPIDIAPLFKDIPENVALPKVFWESGSTEQSGSSITSAS